MSNLAGSDGAFSSGNTGDDTSLPPSKKKRNLPGTPDPTAEVIALSPSSLTATNRFVCEICSKGFQRDQNLQLHRRGHNLPWKLKQRTSSDARKRVYVCPELSCVHHNPARALGDLTGIKKHYSRKHGERKWKCDRCLKKYAVQSDWKAHLKTCGTRVYKCDCGTIFSRKDSFITHRAFCEALTEENNKMNQEMLQSQQMSDDYMNTRNSMSTSLPEFNNYNPKSPLKLHPQEIPMLFRPMNISVGLFSSSSGTLLNNPIGESSLSIGLELSSSNGLVGYGNFQQGNGTEGLLSGPMAHMSETALLQKAAEIGATASNIVNSLIFQKSYVTSMAGPDQPDSDGPRPSPSYCNIQGPFHNLQTQPEENNALPNPILQHTFGPGPGPKPVLDADPVVNNIGVNSDILKGADQSIGLMNMEHGDRRNSNSDLIHGIGDTGIGRSVLGGGGGDTLIVDFLGTG